MKTGGGDAEDVDTFQCCDFTRDFLHCVFYFERVAELTMLI
jgi:hypothetical protein